MDNASQDSLNLAEGNLRLVLTCRSLSSAHGEYAPTYRFVIGVGDQEVGWIDLRVAESDFFVRFAGQIGYVIDPQFRGNRYATRALRLLRPLARRHGLATLWITCNPENIASRRTCELAGASFVEIVDLPEDCEMYAAGERQKCRYRLAV